MRLHHISLVSLIFLFANNVWAQTCAQKKEDNLIRAGYLPDYRASSINLNEAVMHLTDLILFSIQPTFSGSIQKSTCCLDESIYARARAARQYKLDKEEEAYWERESRRAAEMEASGGVDDSCYSDEMTQNPLRIMVSVGGAGRSDAFSFIVKSKKKRKKLISQLKNLCLREELDGVDFDWERPSSEDDYKNYLTLFEEMKKAFKDVDRKLYLSVAIHPDQLLPERFTYPLDRIHMMLYDMGPKKGEPFTHHATYDLAVDIVDHFVKSETPSTKIVLGIPLYARYTNNPAEVKSYSEIIDMMKEEEEALDVNSNDFKTTHNYAGYAMDSPDRVAKKVKYAKEKGLGGVFYWEIGHDYQGDDLSPGGVLMEAGDVEARK